MNSYHLLSKQANPWQSAPGVLQAPAESGGVGGYLNKNKFSLAGSIGGGWAGGAATGAALGTMFLPGIGTAIGAGIGGLAGGFAGEWAGSKLDNAVNPTAPEPVTGAHSYGVNMLQQGMAANK